MGTAEVGGPGRKLGALLIVEDDEGVARAVARVVPEALSPVTVRTVADARRVAPSLELAGAVIDIGLPDGSGLEVVRMLRHTSDEIPVVVLTGLLSPELVNEVTALGARYVCKPDFSLNLHAFFKMLSRRSAQTGLVDAAVLRATRERGLTKREADILGHALDGVPRAHLAEVLGLSENTVKKYVRSLLDKMSQTSLSETVWMMRQLADGDTRDAASGSDVG